MKAFDLSKAREGATVCTRDGRTVRIICYDAKWYEEKRIVALVKDMNGNETTNVYHDNGSYYLDRNDANDLFLASKKIEGWVNVYRLSNGRKGCMHVYPSKEEAIDNISKEKNCICLATVKIEWEE